MPTVAALANGARLLVVENRAVPLVSIEIVLRAGVDQEPATKGGLAGFTADMLTEGTGAAAGAGVRRPGRGPGGAASPPAPTWRRRGSGSTA